MWACPKPASLSSLESLTARVPAGLFLILLSISPTVPSLAQVGIEPPVIAVGIGSRLITYQYNRAEDLYRQTWESQPTGRFDYQNADTHWQPVFGDPDGDGEAELVSIDQWMLNVWGDTGNTPIRVPLSTEPYSYGSLAVADVDGDGREEILVGWRNTLMLWRYEEGQLSVLAEITVGHGRRDMIWNINSGDLDLDGKPEILLGGTLTDGRSFVLQIVRYRQGELIVGESIPIQLYADVTRLFDWDGDGDLEIFTSGNHQRILGIEFDHRSHRFKPFWRSEDLDAYIQGLALGDLDGDGLPELVAGTYVYPDHHNSSPGLYIFSDLGDGHPAMVYHVTSPQVGYPGLLVQDLDGDDELEILVNGSRVYEVGRTWTGHFHCSHTHLLGDVKERAGEVQPNAAVTDRFQVDGEQQADPVVLIQYLTVTSGGSGQMLGIGQEVTLAFRAENVGWEASDVRFELVCDDDRVEVDNTVFLLDFLNSFASVNNVAEPFILKVRNDAHPGPITFHIDVESEDGTRYRRTFSSFHLASFPPRR